MSRYQALYDRAAHGYAMACQVKSRFLQVKWGKGRMKWLDKKLKEEGEK